jgi:hypothetical protein
MQEVTKNHENGAVSNQLTTLEGEGYMGIVNLLMCGKVQKRRKLYFSMILSAAAAAQTND